MAKLYATRYPTMNWSDYNASLKRRGSLSVWFDQKMTWYARRSGKRGHPETSSDSTIQTRRTLKALFGLPLRRSEPVRRHWSEAHGEGHTFPWDGEWLACKHDSTRRCECRKAHLAMDTVTGDIRAVEFTSSRQGDSSILPELLSQIPDGENIDTVTTDGAHDTGRCHAAILEHGGEPIIPIRRHGGAWKPDCSAAISRNKILSVT